ncbi:adenosylcobinamide-GDP ribazoletransferase [Gordonia sp. Z-3]|jgi:adenosylcobinamide-GDP ribazoletransferase|uniref:adenosylcobinamide-GDP ribazoletransferase n=1 Tax=unclassified Gordonia (in: high G+C Gram-positive bacteria) TaxID=2657482 RepID=UPI000C600B8B|nr:MULTISPECIES: adenosylcobinamide-GDP ribazoletransferase [unclassified Gordonia (in: high G+C Gram-positive bacteria)]MAU84593.1 adenosylcobinamide-GDP ribazoletransferase [Gordonia sp. (in: high G+C Gram-positive bacteria)]MED5801521.1 adenosylcobinamide-GDP ribazoletransferase [Gordonia sp. Z-3]
MPSPVRAVYVALSWLTVVPLPQPAVAMDRRVGAAVMAAVPVVGVTLGALGAAFAAALSFTELPTALIGLLIVAALALLTRGMHIDGLADTADGLGCYGPPDRVVEVMRSGSSGPFGVASIVVVLAIQAVGFGALTDQHRWYELAYAIALGRLVAVIGARRGLHPARAEGFGALVAGTQRMSIAVWAAAAVVGAIGVGWQADGLDFPAAGWAVAVVAVVVTFGWFGTAHCARRIGGINGDVLGAGTEVGVAIAVIGLLI